MILFHLAFLLGQLLHNNSIVDPLWGLGFVAVAWYTIANAEILSLNHIVITSLVTIWGCRLTFHIFRRNKGKGEDWRYEEWRKLWGKWAVIRAYVSVYLTQAIFMFIIALPIIYVNSHDVSTLGFYLLSAGLTIWVIGYFFESVGDRELRDFRANPKNKGKVMSSGLWRYTRHPNYFGEATMWWGVWIISMASLPFQWGLVISPATITFLLVKISGIPLLERKMMKDKMYRTYAARTSIFIPRKPKNI